MEQQKVISKGVTLQCESSRVEEKKHILDTDYADDMALLDNTEGGVTGTTQRRGYRKPPMQIQRICGT